MFTLNSDSSKCFKTIANTPTVNVFCFSMQRMFVKLADIGRQLVKVYGENVMMDGMVRKWVKQFNYGQTNVHDEAWSWQPSVVNDDLIEKVDEKFCENRRFTIQLLCDEFIKLKKNCFV